MKMQKKSLALLIALLIVVALFAGCSSQTGDSVEETQAPADTPSQAADQDDDLTDDSSASVYPLADELTTLTMFKQSVSASNPDLPYAETIGGVACWDYVEEITNVHIEFVEIAGSAMSEKLGVMLASMDMTDFISGGICLFYNGGNTSAYENGLIVALDEYAEDYLPNYMSWVNSSEEYRKECYTDDQNMLAFKKFCPNYYVQLGCVVRQDWLDELGLEKPDTVSEIYEALTAMKVEYDSSATFQLNSYNQLGNYLVSAYGTPGYDLSPIVTAHNHLYQIDGVVKSALVETGYQDYLREIAKWYEEGLISNDFMRNMSHAISFLDATNRNDIVNSQSGIFFCNSSATYDFYSEAADEGFELTGLQYPTLEEGDVTHLTDIMTVYLSDTVVSTSCENPELAMQYMDFWYSEEGYNYTNLGVEGLNYDIIDGEPQFNDLIYNNEWGVSSLHARAAFCLNGNVAWSIEDYYWRYSTMDEAQQNISSIMAQNTDNAWLLPSGLTLSVDETDTISFSLPDAETLASEAAAKFITGEWDIDADWESYVETIEDIGIYDVIEIYQNALDRYYSR